MLTCGSKNFGTFGRDGDVARGDEVESRPTAQAVDGGDDGLGHRPERRRRLLRRLPLRVGREVRLVVDHAAVVWNLGHVGTGAEGSAVARDDDGPDRLVCLGGGVRPPQLPDHDGVDGVQLLGPVEGDGDRVSVDLVEDGVKVHRVSFLAALEPGVSALLEGEKALAEVCGA